MVQPRLSNYRICKVRLGPPQQSQSCARSYCPTPSVVFTVVHRARLEMRKMHTAEKLGLPRHWEGALFCRSSGLSADNSVFRNACQTCRLAADSSMSSPRFTSLVEVADSSPLVSCNCFAGRWGFQPLLASGCLHTLPWSSTLMGPLLFLPTASEPRAPAVRTPPLVSQACETASYHTPSQESVAVDLLVLSSAIREGAHTPVNDNPSGPRRVPEEGKSTSVSWICFMAETLASGPTFLCGLGTSAPAADEPGSVAARTALVSSCL